MAHLSYIWHFGVLLANWPFLVQGLGTTIELAATTLVTASVGGLALALMRQSKFVLIRAVAVVYTEFFRSLPGLVLVLWVYYAIPLITGVDYPAFLAGVIGLTLNSSAFVAEIVRAGLSAIAAGQRDAALALGMTQEQMYRRILLPQAGRQMVPPLGNMWVGLLKDTSLVSLIAVADLNYQGIVLAVLTYSPLEIYTAVAAIYFVLAYPQARLVGWLEARFALAK